MKKITLLCAMSLLFQVAYPSNFGSDFYYAGVPDNARQASNEMQTPEARLLEERLAARLLERRGAEDRPLEGRLEELLAFFRKMFGLTADDQQPRAERSPSTDQHQRDVRPLSLCDQR